MQQIIQTQQEKMERRRKISAHSIFPTHNGALSHVGAFVATLGFIIYSSSDNKGSENKESLIRKHLDSTINFIHLLTFATWLGIQVWVHVSGFTMFKTLTRNAFAQVQKKIFPMYFMSGIIMSTISLLTHLYTNPVKSWQLDSLSLYQALSISLVCSLVNYFYLGAETIRMVQIRAQRMKFLGIEDGVGLVSPKLVEHDLTYREIKKRFIKMHAACSMVNVICYGACGVNLWCLASKKILC